MNILNNVWFRQGASENIYAEMFLAADAGPNALLTICWLRFIDDLYFLKKHGNNSAHSVKVHKDGIEALECLQRAFEVAINYCVYSNGAGSKLLKLRYDTELLVTGVKSKKSLSDRYIEEKSKSKPKSEHKQKIQSYKDKSGVSLFWKFVGVCSFISAVMLLLMALIS